MNSVETEATEPRLKGSVIAALAVALLEATRSHDRPDEVLEDEDITISMPRRLGLSGVVETQIQRYETAVREGRRLPLDEFVNLLKLVLRRPDAEPSCMRPASAWPRAPLPKRPASTST